jgi:cell division protein FtsQ
VAAILESNPWVAKAEVTVTWPGTVGVTVEERVPAAWVDTGDRWVLVAVDGMVVAGGNPPGDAPRVEGEVSGLRPGDRLGDEAAAAVVGFLGRLPPEVVAGATGAATPRGGVVSLGTITVLFGDGTDLDLKAAAVTALLDRGVAPGSTINVISPSRPAVSPG